MWLKGLIVKWGADRCGHQKTVVSIPGLTEKPKTVWRNVDKQKDFIEACETLMNTLWALLLNTSFCARVCSLIDGAQAPGIYFRITLGGGK